VVYLFLQIVNCVVEPLLRAINLSASRLTSVDMAVYLLNCIDEITNTLSVYEFTDDWLERLQVSNGPGQPAFPLYDTKCWSVIWLFGPSNFVFNWREEKISPDTYSNIMYISRKIYITRNKVHNYNQYSVHFFKMNPCNENLHTCRSVAVLQTNFRIESSWLNNYKYKLILGNHPRSHETTLISREMKKFGRPCTFHS